MQQSTKREAQTWLISSHNALNCCIKVKVLECVHTDGGRYCLQVATILPFPLYINSALPSKR